MLISRNWLQSYFETELPDAQSIADTLMLHSFEIEGIEYTDNDAVIDIDVLPNRAHDCLSYSGIADEYKALTGYELKKERYHYHNTVSHAHDGISVTITNTEQCYRYIARTINNISVHDSPRWLQERIASIGQRSINNIVDATNYVMFDTGNPMHAFDADKVTGDITIRNAHAGETMDTLSGETIELLETDLVVADDEGVLALAGVKGGTKAEVDENTKNIVLEVANFNPTTTRTTARRVKILTDASKRFENGISSELAPIAMESVSRLVSDCAHTDELVLGELNDIYPKQEPQTTVMVSLTQIQSLLGVSINQSDVDAILERLNYQNHYHDGVYTVHVPYNRLDITIAEDIIEEIGRIYGYHNIKAKPLDNYIFTPKINKNIFVEQQLRNFLIQKGFSDVMTYSFVKKGDIEMFNPIASDKKSLRKTLHKQINESLEKNIRNVDYFGTNQIKIFEIGRVYTKEGEQAICSVGIQNNGKQANKKYGLEHVQLEILLKEIKELFAFDVIAEFHGNTLSINLSKVTEKLTTPDEYDELFNNKSYTESDVFHSISIYPFITRDVSFWSPEGYSEEGLQSLISSTKTNFLQKVFLFDTFEKEGKTSFAFSLVFQSNEKTLTDDEVDNDMNNVISELEKIGAEIR